MSSRHEVETHWAQLMRLVEDAVAGRISAGDRTVWPSVAWPGWMHATYTARAIVGAAEALHEEFRLAGLHRVVLVTTAGVGIAAEAVGLSQASVLDGTDPEAVAEVLAGDLETTCVVTVLPPDATPREVADVALVHEVLTDALRAEGLDPDQRTILVHAPGANPPVVAGHRLAGPPDVAGLWSALTAYALIPAALAGINVGRGLGGLLMSADAEADLPVNSEENDGLRLGVALAGARTVAVTGTPVPRLPQLAGRTTGSPALAEWAAALVASGLGKHGTGPLPVLLDGTGQEPPDGALLIEVMEPDEYGEPKLGSGRDDATRTEGNVIAQMLLWQYAVAAAAYLLEIDPTEGPDDRGLPHTSGDGPPAFVDGAVAVYADGWLPDGVRTVGDALRALVDPAGEPATHLAVHAYLDRWSDASAAVLRSELARRTGLTTTFGWAPRCLAGTGRYDRAGPGRALVCQITGDAGGLYGAPVGAGDRSAELAARQRAGAVADGAALTHAGRRVLRLHLTDRVAGLVTLANAVQELEPPTTFIEERGQR